MSVKAYLYIAILVLVVACQPHNVPTKPTGLQVDSVYTSADFRAYGDYYNSGHEVYAIDLLSDGLAYDSAWHISGSGYNLFLSDVFASAEDTMGLPAGSYEMDSVVRVGSFLRGMNFEGSITGSYLLQIHEDKIQRIILFSTGHMTVDYVADDIVLDLHLYTEDSTHYHATYMGPVMYR